VLNKSASKQYKRGSAKREKGRYSVSTFTNRLTSYAELALALHLSHGDLQVDLFLAGDFFFFNHFCLFLMCFFLLLLFFFKLKIGIFKD
jgi:hypothetical protein